jgi:RNA recognition motif-containing protein
MTATDEADAEKAAVLDKSESDLEEPVAHTSTEGAQVEAEEAEEKEIRLQTNKVFINNLPYKTTEAELKDFLSREGNVIDVRLHYRLLQDGQKQSRGYGLVMFETCEEAHKVIDALDGVTYKGRTLHLRVDNASKMNSEEEAVRNVDKKVFVDYLHPSLTWQVRQIERIA